VALLHGANAYAQGRAAPLEKRDYFETLTWQAAENGDNAPAEVAAGFVHVRRSCGLWNGGSLEKAYNMAD
jgi:hypothetical protein